MGQQISPTKTPRLYATYSLGLFSGGQWDMMGVIIPLFSVFVGLNPSEIGLVVAARSALPVLFSVHGGILMDRLGVRLVGFWVGLAAAILPLFYPFAGWFWGLVVLQLLSGLITTLAMASGQTSINRFSKGDPAVLGRYSFVTRFGNFFGPFIIGLIWHHFGSGPTFITISLWGVLTVISVLFIPSGTQPKKRGKTSCSDLLSRRKEFMRALSLAAIPTVSFVLLLTVFRNCPGAIQASFFVVYLNQIGISGTIIGFLTGLAEVFVGLGSLTAGWFAARANAHWLVILFVASAIFLICLTPLIAGVMTLLITATAARGFAQGINQPLIFSILSRAINDKQQGAAVGLRNTVNRFSNIIVPIVMGFMAEWWGIEVSFIIIAVLFIGACMIVAAQIRYFGFLAGEETCIGPKVEK
ncbi:MAG: hypothetical protein CMM57_08860 [Rhodospirillaceae bacterium]|nr:hypothetical protein [Rhodospirillaceae bacterium]